MDKSRVAGLLAGYSPPLSPTQVDAIAEEISKISTAEIKAAIKKVTAAKAKPKRKSQSPC